MTDTPHSNRRRPLTVLCLLIGVVALNLCRAHATSCTCADICDIDNAASEARGAQWEYQIQIDLLRVADENSFTGTSTWFLPGRYGDIQKSVQKRINENHASCNPPLNGIRADTNGGDCTISIRPTSACMTEFAQAHEEVHQKTCQSFSHILTYQMSMSMADVLAEEIRGYQTAIDLRNSLRTGPLKDCCCKNKCTPTTITGALGTLRKIVMNLVR